MKAYQEFEDFYRRDLGVPAPIEPKYLVEQRSNSSDLQTPTVPAAHGMIIDGM